MNIVIKRFSAALNGLYYLLKEDRSIKTHLLIAFTLTITSLFLDLKMIEWLFIITSFGLVISLEILNTTVEKFCDFIHPTYHPDIGVIKDISADAVLVVSIISAVIGLILLLPKLLLIYYSLINHSLVN